ncbi:MAG: NAD-dependent epimerase/dehydratase family protein [Gammaproteobacteria bacterium]
MNILVTGSSGFVGRHLLTHLKNNTNSNCIGITRTSSKNIDNNTVICDLNDKTQIDKLIKKLQRSLIFHAAGSFSNDFETDFQNNVRCTKNILDSVKENSPTSRVLLMGSAAEYGEINNDENPVTEDHPLNPISIYGWSKAAQTQLAHLYAKTYGVNIVIARTFNLIGKGMSDKLFVGRVERQINAVLSGEAENISVGSLDAERDYIDIENACAMYYTIAAKGKAGEAYNVGSGAAISMKDLLNNLLHQAGLNKFFIDKNTNHKNTPHSEVSVIYANISKVTKLMSTT